MDEIAREVGLGKAAIYYYFPAKENLFQAVVLQEQEEFIANTMQIMRKGITAGQKLHSYVHCRLEHFARMMSLDIMDAGSSVDMKPLMKDMFEEFRHRELRILRHIMREGKRNGEFDIASTEKVAEAFLHTMKGIRLCRVRAAHGLRVEGRQIELLKNELALVTGIFLHGICRTRLSASRN